MGMPPGYDDWKTGGADPYYQSAAQEAAQRAEYEQHKDDLREAIAAVLIDDRRGLYLADVREVVIQELNKLKPLAGEPAWQTRTPVPIPQPPPAPPAGQTGADAGQHQRSPGFEGMDARRNGLPCEACPYEPGPARTAWVVGWYVADHDPAPSPRD